MLCKKCMLFVNYTTISTLIKEAVPSPVPAPLAVKYNPTVFADAPIKVKSVVPVVNILYSIPTTNAPAVTSTLFINFEPEGNPAMTAAALLV